MRLATARPSPPNDSWSPPFPWRGSMRALSKGRGTNVKPLIAAPLAVPGRVPQAERTHTVGYPPFLTSNESYNQGWSGAGRKGCTPRWCAPSVRQVNNRSSRYHVMAELKRFGIPSVLVVIVRQRGFASVPLRDSMGWFRMVRGPQTGSRQRYRTGDTCLDLIGKNTTVDRATIARYCSWTE